VNTYSIFKVLPVLWCGVLNVKCCFFAFFHSISEFHISPVNLADISDNNKDHQQQQQQQCAVQFTASAAIITASNDTHTS